MFRGFMDRRNRAYATPESWVRQAPVKGQSKLRPFQALRALALRFYRVATCAFGFRISAFLRPSGFGLRISALTAFLLTFPAPGSAQVVRPLPIPGRIQAEDYDTGGAGVSYYDDSAGNSGGVYRQDDVDVEATTDTGGGYDVGWIGAGEWLNYTVNVQQTAIYQLAFRVAALDSAGTIQVSLDGLPLCAVSTPSTGGWQNWQSVTVSNIVLAAGPHLLRLDFQTGGCNLNYVDVTRQANLTGGFLRASGKQIVDGQGHNIILRGMGIGNWMLQEPYMMGLSGLVDNQHALKARITDLVGANNMAAFYFSWLTNYFTESDVACLASNGFNSIRLPMHYELLTLPVDQEPVPGRNTWLESGFQLIDSLLGWCELHHLYLILDMHACPGGQGHDKAISDYSPPAPSLWESAANRDKLVALWQELARRYANRSWIGGYDLINEPNWTFEDSANINGCSDTTNAPLRQLLMDMTAAVRQVDTNHIIFLMGNCWGGNYRGILPPWDPNLVIGFHKYWDDPSTNSMLGWVNTRDQWNMPLWLGESGENSNEWFRDAVFSAEQLNIGWAWWPWKKADSVAGTVAFHKTAGYQDIIDYLKGNGPRPATNTAMAALLELAQQTRLENCVLHPDVFDALMRPHSQGATKPYAAQSIPGVVFAVNYDLGRQEEAYHDSTSGNSGSSYRNDSVDIESCTNTSPSIGFDVGWLDSGDWMKYTVAPLAPGPYVVYARVAAGGSGGTFYLDVGGANATGNVSVPATGGWQSWKTIPAGYITSRQLLTSFKFVVASSGFNLNWLMLQSPPQLTPSLAPGGSHITLSWPGWATNFSLYTTTNLAPPVLWLPVTSAVKPGDPLSVTVPLISSNQFFRLAGQ